MAETLNISQIDVKKNDGIDISGQEEINYRNSAKKYLDRQRAQLTSTEYQSLEQKIKTFLESVDVDMQGLEKKFEALKSDTISEAKGKRDVLRGDAEITKAKSSAEFILESIGITNKELTKRVEVLTKKDESFANFVSPENMMGLSTRFFDGNTVTGMKLQALKDFSGRSHGTEKQLKMVIQKLDEGMSMAEARTIPSLQSFFASPEGKYLTDIMTGRQEEAYQKYLLNMARLYKQMDCPLDAELYYDKLDKTPLESVAKAERMGKMERFQRKGLTGFANDFLSLDQLAIMAAGGAIGRGVGWAVGKSTTLSKVAVVTGKAIEGSKLAKIFLPGVQVLKSGAGEKIIVSIGKGLGNIALDTAKFMAYSSAAEAIGGEDAGKAVRLALAVIPGAKAGFESQMGVNLVKDTRASGKLSEWMIKKYGPKETEQMIYQGLVKEAEGELMRKANRGPEAMKTGRLFQGLSKEVIDGFAVTAKTTTSQLENLASKVSKLKGPVLSDSHGPAVSVTGSQSSPTGPKIKTSSSEPVDTKTKLVEAMKTMKEGSDELMVAKKELRILQKQAKIPSKEVLENKIKDLIQKNKGSISREQKMQNLEKIARLEKDINATKPRRGSSIGAGERAHANRELQGTKEVLSDIDIPGQITLRAVKNWVKNNPKKAIAGALIVIGGATYMVVKDKDGNSDVVPAPVQETPISPVTPPEGQSETQSPEGATPEQGESLEDSTESTQPSPKPGKKSSGGTSKPTEGPYTLLTPEQIKEGVIGTVTTRTGKLNVRDENGKVIGKLNKGEQVTLTGDTKDINGRKYIKVKSGGKEGFVAMDFIKVDVSVDKTEKKEDTGKKIRALAEEISVAEKKVGDLSKESKATLEAGKPITVADYTITQGKVGGYDYDSENDYKGKNYGTETFKSTFELYKKDGQYVLEMNGTGVFKDATEPMGTTLPTRQRIGEIMEKMRDAKQKDGLENYAVTTGIYEVKATIKDTI